MLFPLALLALAASSTMGGGQQPPASHPAPGDNKPALRNKSNDVTIPVTVRNKKDELVPNLQAGDFSLTEDGRPQTLASVTQNPNGPFRIGLLVETDRSLSGAMEAERKAAEKFVDLLLPPDPAEGKPAGPANQMFLIHFDREVELLEDFTGSRDNLHRELDDMGPTHPGQKDNQGPETAGDDRERPSNHNGNQLYDAIFLASDEVMGTKPGRNVLILFSDGVDRGSKDRLNEALDAAEKAHSVIYTIYSRGQQDRVESMGSPGGTRPGGGYPGGGYPGRYPGGGGYPGGYPGGGGGRRGGDRGPTAYGVDGRKIMQQIADRTGGHAYDARKNSDLEPIYNLIAQELRAQYLLTYTPDKPDTDGGFHKIAVTVNKNDTSVVAPEGYFAPGADTSR